jgi:hypothetical protein
MEKLNTRGMNSLKDFVHILGLITAGSNIRKMKKAHKIVFRNPKAKEPVDLEERTSECISKMFVLGLRTAIRLAGQSCLTAEYLTRIVTIWAILTAKYF